MREAIVNTVPPPYRPTAQPPDRLAVLPAIVLATAGAFGKGGTYRAVAHKGEGGSTVVAGTCRAVARTGEGGSLTVVELHRPAVPPQPAAATAAPDALPRPLTRLRRQ